MKKLLSGFIYFLLGLCAIVILGIIVFNIYYDLLNHRAKNELTVVQTLTDKGFTYRDLNKNGRLDLYEDSRVSVEDRVSDLMKQMNLEEKVGLMWHPPIGVGTKGEVIGKPTISALSFSSSYDMLLNKKITHYNLFLIPKSTQLASWYNAIQNIAGQSRLGIPLTISTDPRHGITNFLGNKLLDSDFSKWPEPIGLAATGDSDLVAEFGRIANQEYRAVGIRTALHPMADLSTEPRWARMNGTFGEDAELASKMIAAYIQGFQGDHLGPKSVACMTKHFSGGGPQGGGNDAHFRYGKFQQYPGNNFKYHLIPFEAAFKAGTAMIMPYYGIPTNQTSENVGMSYNKEIITGLLRDKYKYDGIVCTDWGILQGFSFLGYEIVEPKNWGVEKLSISERIKKAIDAGVDQFGGNDNTDELIKLVKDGQIAESRIDQSVRRLLRAKFAMGLFDNPFVDESQASQIVGKKEFVDKGKLAQRKSIVLLKNYRKPDSSFVLPLKKGIKIYVENIDREIASSYGTVVDSVGDADFAVLRLNTPYVPRMGDMIERMFHQGDLDFKDPEKSRLLIMMKLKPTIVCINLDRAAVIPEIAAHSSGLLADFGAADDAVLDVVFGKFNPNGKMPFELPSSMDAVVKQKEDLPHDSENPLFPFGWGLKYKN